MYSIPDCILTAFTVGAFFGLVYEALRIFRVITRNAAVTFICDIVFFVLSAGVCMFLSEMLGNCIRGWTIIGFGAGVFTYIVTIGRIFNIAENAMASAWRKALGKAAKGIRKGTAKVFGTIAQKSKAEIGKVYKHFSTVEEKRRGHLKLSHKKLYNNKRYINVGESEKSNVIKAKVTRSSREY